MNTYRTGVNSTPGMESTPVKRTTDSSSVGQHYADLGAAAAKLADFCSKYNGASWGDIMLCDFKSCESCRRYLPDYRMVGELCDSCVPRPPTPEPTRAEFLFKIYMDYVEDPWKYGKDLEAEMAETEAELRKIGAWADVESHLNHLAEVERVLDEERAAEMAKAKEQAAIQEEKDREHKLKIAAMEEAARKAIAEDKARVAAALAARQVATVKNGRACKYFRNDGSPEPAQEGWVAGCGYHKEGKCPCIHPDEPGWDEAVANRKAHGRPPSHHHGGNRSYTTGGGVGFRKPNGGTRFSKSNGSGSWRGSTESHEESWRNAPVASGCGKPTPKPKAKNSFAGLEDDSSGDE